MRRYVSNLAVSAGIAALLGWAGSASAQTAPSLGSAESYAVLGGSTVTNTGPTSVTGDLGVSPGSAVTGFPPGVVVAGSIHSADASAASAQSDANTAYNVLAGQACDQDLSGQDLGGLTLTSGVYCFDSSAQLTGTLTLDAQGDSGAVFIFQIGSTLTTASGSSVEMINSGSSCNVFWQVGSSATLGTSSSFAGNILALTSITLTTGASVEGRTLALNGAVTLDSSSVFAPCAAPPVCPDITLTPSTLPGGTIGVAYHQTITGSGGTAPYTFSLTSGSLPAGLTLTSAGVLSGSPTSSGSSTFTIRGTDANGCFAELEFTVDVVAAPPPPPVCPPITLSPSTLPDGTVGAAYNQTILGSGGTAPYVFGVVSGTLPAGLTLSPAGVLSGTPTSAGSSTFTIRGTDANGCFAELEFSIDVVAAPPPPPVCPPIALAPPTLPNGTLGVAYSQTLTGSGGTAPYTFGVVSGALPAGLTLSSAGVLSGTPIQASSPAREGPAREGLARGGRESLAATLNSTFTIRVTDANGCFAERAYAIFIAGVPPPPPVCPTVTLSPPALPSGKVGVAYTQTITGSGGAAPYTFGVTSGVLPLGLVLTSAGVLSGTPTDAGSSIVTIRGTDANGCFAELTYTIVIAATPPPPPTCPPITLSPSTLPNGLLGVAYHQTITGSGGSAPYTFGVTSGVLPAGLTLTSAGVVSGTPTNAGSSTFTIRGTDANGCFKELSFTIVVPVTAPPPPVCPPITLLPPTLPNATYGVAYLETITGHGGTGPYTFGVVSGALPLGLTLTSGGVLAGTPILTARQSRAGIRNSTFTIRGTDANGCFAEISFMIEVNSAPPPPPQCPPITLSPSVLPGGVVGMPYQQQISGSGGTGPYSFGVVSGALPAGLTLTSAGLLSGTPSNHGSSTITIRGTDANGCFAEIVFTIVTGTAVPTLPQVFFFLLALGLAWSGYRRVQRLAPGS